MSKYRNPVRGLPLGGHKFRTVLMNPIFLGVGMGIFLGCVSAQTQGQPQPKSR